MISVSSSSGSLIITCKLYSSWKWKSRQPAVIWWWKVSFSKIIHHFLVIQKLNTGLHCIEWDTPPFLVSPCCCLCPSLSFFFLLDFFTIKMYLMIYLLFLNRQKVRRMLLVFRGLKDSSNHLPLFKKIILSIGNCLTKHLIVWHCDRSLTANTSIFFVSSQEWSLTCQYWKVVN